MFTRVELTPDPNVVPIFVRTRTPLLITETPQQMMLRQKKHRQRLFAAAGIAPSSYGETYGSQEILDAYDAIRQSRTNGEG